LYGQATPGRTACDLNGDNDGVLFCGNKLNTSYATAIDKCGGATDGTTNTYGYNIPPVCLIEQLKGLTATDTHVLATTDMISMFGGGGSFDAMGNPSPQIGWGMDGFPVYGPLGPRGLRMFPCGTPGAHESICLDVCNGYEGEISSMDNFTYRYMNMR
jgi:hypothetical protein